jgi:pimeloyl-ACP methyl ester carboxylesterase
MLRQGSGEPLVLFHGILGSERMWRHVVPLLAPHHDTIALTALGHKGGPPAARRPVIVKHLLDDAERVLDSLGIATAHLAGNSMGGWMAIELARRGRARSVCALSPGGFWEVNSADSNRTVGVLKRTIADTRRGRPLLPLLAYSRRFRRWALGSSALHGDRVTREELLEGADDVLGCTIAGDILGTLEFIAPLEPLPCPMTIAWSRHDRVLPMNTAGERAKERMPAARFLVLEDVGHVPMWDDPDLVTRTILETTRAVPRATTPKAVASNV